MNEQYRLDHTISLELDIPGQFDLQVTLKSGFGGWNTDNNKLLAGSFNPSHRTYGRITGGHEKEIRHQDRSLEHKQSEPHPEIKSLYLIGLLSKALMVYCPTTRASFSHVNKYLNLRRSVS